ncbi:FxSxx-COOH system tetratricopeptide repeat protein [Actinokineospora globicatena]|uniref:FxSxx-COOH system tetratricopeptide repeat protein n=1 Tax=Actinokineospora globicatena TaxID=103729 RepID=UPI0024A448F1|nr:FxSxx-COOH system tetratricopeptide repeat protein [Actinokineospora globicatena]GLW80012.1 tetratricopeptide repeat protein [Actinokineospora globicatena]GLW86841.1 tetratricopeptide repeat protein [Actinokineospora globicatena]
MSQDTPERPVHGNTVANNAGKLVQARDIHGGVHLHGPAAAEVRFPCRFGQVPPRAAGFQQRDQAGLLPAAGECVVVTGPGGAGKTQLAADFVERVWAGGEAEVVAWVPAASRDEVVSAYTALAGRLSGVDRDPPDAVRWVLGWLAETPVSWLLVLDDVWDPQDVHGLWPAPSTNGRVVVTTRRQDAALKGHGRRTVAVGMFTPEQSRACLTGVLADRPHLLDGVDEVVQELGHLPLAVGQAGAYMADRNLTCGEYLRRWRDRDRRLSSLFPPERELPEGRDRTVAVTWSLSIELADTLDPVGVAGPLMHIASVLDPNGIPLPVLTAPPVLEHLSSTRGTLVSEDDARDALGRLERLSLITLDTPTGTGPGSIRVHSLAQRATREATPSGQFTDHARVAADALWEVWPEIEIDTGLAMALRANTTTLTAIAGPLLFSPDAHAVVFRVGQSLGEAGQVTAALGHFTTLYATTLTHLGPDHPDTLLTRHNIASWRGDSGDVLGALAEFEALLPDRTRVLGADHPSTLLTRHNIASWRGRTGIVLEALGECEVLLTDQTRVLGADHPYTLATRHNIASWRGESGDALGALGEFDALLADQTRVLGADHPSTLLTRNNVASWRGESGDALGALGEFDALLADQTRVLGADHPDTLATRSNIASWRGRTRDVPGALGEFEALLADQTRVLGADHPDTLITRSNIAAWQADSGDVLGALSEFEALLTDRTRILSADHPSTLTTRSNIAYWRGRSGDAQKALSEFEALLTDRTRVLGAGHPDTLTTRSNIASWRGRTGDAQKALNEFEALLTDRTRILGAGHPDTLTIRSNIAYWRKIADEMRRS